MEVTSGTPPRLIRGLSCTSATPPDSASKSDLLTVVSTYGTMRRTHSSTGIMGRSSRSSSAASVLAVGEKPLGSSQHGSFVDLPMVAIPGLSSRVSISGTTAASQLDLQDFFKTGEVEAVQVEGGWTFSLFMSGATALLSALAFGYSNGNMNTQAAVMREVMHIPPRTPDLCSPARPLPANDGMWGFCVSVFCLSALLGAAQGGRLADRWGRCTFLQANGLVYVVAGTLEVCPAAAAGTCRPANAPAHAVTQCTPSLAGGRVAPGVRRHQPLR